MSRYVSHKLGAALLASAAIVATSFATTAPAAEALIDAGPPAAEIHSLIPSTGAVPDLPGRYRPPACANRNQFRFVAVYARPSDAPDRYAYTVGAIRDAVLRANAFVSDEARGLGVGRFDLKFECADRVPTVLNAVLRTSSSAASFGSIESDLRSLGLTDWRAKYWVWYDGSVQDNVCGEARRAGDGSLTANNRANQGPDFAVAYAHITACGSVASTLLHEATHTMGAVADGAWGNDRHGHCADGEDIMCSGGYICPTMRYDCGHDTYFDPKPSPREYLYRHWNIAFCVNRFISRSGCMTKPRDLRASSTGYGVSLRWRAPQSTGGAPVGRYEVLRRTCRDCPWNVVEEVPGSRTSWTDFTFGFRYEYRVRAVNVWADAGPLSNVAAGGLL